jgi:hypothetical protein
MLLSRLGVAPTTPGASGGRDNLVAGTYRPGATTTGYLTGTSFTVVSGNVTHSTPSTVYRNTKFEGKVTRAASNCSYLNCWFAGEASPVASSPLVNCDNDYTGTYFEDCTFQPGTPNVYHSYGVVGEGFTAKRCYFRYAIDGVRIRNLNGAVASVTIEQSFIDELAWWASDPDQVDGSHNDGIQMEGGSGIVIRYNYIRGYSCQTPGIGDQPTGRNPSQPQALSALMYTNNVNAINAQVYSNWLAGGEITINATKDSLSGTDIGSISDNTFEANSYYSGHSLDVQSGMTYSQTNNRYESGTLITVHSG